MSALRRMAVPIGFVAAVLLVLLFNPWVVIEEGSTLRAVLTVAFWIAFLLLLVALFEDRRDPQAGDVEVEGPRFARFPFNNTRAGLFWREVDEGGFRRSVVDRRGVGLVEGVDRGDIDDRTRRLRQHRNQHSNIEPFAEAWSASARAQLGA